MSLKDSIDVSEVKSSESLHFSEHSQCVDVSCLVPRPDTSRTDSVGTNKGKGFPGAPPVLVVLQRILPYVRGFSRTRTEGTKVLIWRSLKFLKQKYKSKLVFMNINRCNDNHICSMIVVSYM